MFVGLVLCLVSWVLGVEVGCVECVVELVIMGIGDWIGVFVDGVDVDVEVWSCFIMIDVGNGC